MRLRLRPRLGLLRLRLRLWLLRPRCCACGRWLRLRLRMAAREHASARARGRTARVNARMRVTARDAGRVSFGGVGAGAGECAGAGTLPCAGSGSCVLAANRTCGIASQGGETAPVRCPVRGGVRAGSPHLLVVCYHACCGVAGRMSEARSVVMGVALVQQHPCVASVAEQKSTFIRQARSGSTREKRFDDIHWLN